MSSDGTAGADGRDGVGRIDIVKAIMGAWRGHDIDGVLGHMAPDVVWHYHVGSRPVEGVDNMAKVLGKLQHQQLDSHWRLVRHAESGDAVLIEGVDDFVNPDGHRVRAPYMGVYEFDGRLVTAWRDYVDLGLMMKGGAGEPLDDWLVALVKAGDELP
ncbi:MAG: limonene-1,2-epoxide hydrolase family protein [Actinomycetota bacterium]|jgi:limonene-1,2-epoxide hydrolase|nr:limonene-1,2-epoxide hydrolase family protein [Actinomycetota bacterium]